MNIALAVSKIFIDILDHQYGPKRLLQQMYVYQPHCMSSRLSVTNNNNKQRLGEEINNVCLMSLGTQGLSIAINVV